MGKHSMDEGCGEERKGLSLRAKVLIGATAALLAVGAVTITFINSGITRNVDEGPKQENSVEDYDPMDDGQIEQEFEIDSSAVVSHVIYEGRAVDLRITATNAAAGIGGGEIALRLANESDRDYVVEISDMAVGLDGVSGSGTFELAPMQISTGSVSFRGQHVQEVDDLDLWHGTVTVKTTSGDVVEVGTCSLTGAFD